MKKFLALVLSMVLLASLVVLPASAEEAVTLDNIKIGFVHVGDPSDMGYTYNHNLGTLKMQKTLGLRDDQIVNKFNIPESGECADALQELVDDGCNLIFVTSFGHENYVVAAAKENPDVQFCHATGYQASAADNMHNYFGEIYQARYLSGIAAGLKAKEIGNNLLGYIAAMPFAECISGYTAFYLGAKSVNPDVTMKVMYTNTNNWNDPPREAQVSQALFDAGCGVISQHCDSTAPATTAEANGKFHVGYNSDMTGVAPKASLTSAVWDWSIYLTYAVNCMVNGEEIAKDWSKGLADGVCDISPLNEAIVAPGTAEAIEAARAKIVSGELKIFVGPLKGEGVDFSGNKVSIDLKEGEEFVEPASAPSWNYIIDGIEVIGE